MDIVDRMRDNNYGVEERVELLIGVADRLQNDSGKALTPNGYKLALDALYGGVEDFATPDELIELETFTCFFERCIKNPGKGSSQVTAAYARKKWETAKALTAWNPEAFDLLYAVLWGDE